MIALIAYVVIFLIKTGKGNGMVDEDGNTEYIEYTLGKRNPEYICPHCQTKGFVRTKPVKRKKGISGAKVTWFLLTFGISLVFTGLSRKEKFTQANCEKCNSTWEF